MRNLLALVGLTVVGFGGGGWYMGWYKLSYTRTPDGNLQINANIDTKKVSADTRKAGDEFPDFLQSVGTAISTNVDKTGQAARTAPAATPGPVAPPLNLTPLPPLPQVPVAPVAPPVLPAPIPLRAPN